MNERVEIALSSVERAQAELRRILADLAVREAEPAYNLAVALYARGYRAEGWGLPLTDTDNETRLWNDRVGALEMPGYWPDGSARRIGYWADGVARDTEIAIGYLERAEPDLCAGAGRDVDTALRYLDDLTAEGGERPAPLAMRA